MANPTSNFGWQMPTSSDLVTDLPADFEVFGQAVDTALVDLKGGTTNQVLAKNSNTDMDFKWVSDATGMTNPMTTTGDTIYSSSGSTPARLGIGSTGQILTVAGGIPSWATPSAAGTDWTLLNAGGTALSGAQTITVSGISGKNKIMVLVQTASSASISSAMLIRLNTDSANNYYNYGFRGEYTTNYSAGNFGGYYNNEDGIPIGQMSGLVQSTLHAAVTLDGCNTSGNKTHMSIGCGTSQGGVGQINYSTQGRYNSASTISSISVFSGTGNFDNGTVYVYTSTI